MGTGNPPQLPPPPPGLALIYCLAAAEADPPRPLIFRGGFDSPQLPVRTSPLPVEVEGDQERPIDVRRGFPEASREVPPSPPLQMLEQRPACSAFDDSLVAVQIDQPTEWVADPEPPSDEMRCRSSRESGFAKPGCWSCGEFGHSRIHCNWPPQRLCYMCGRQGITIVTCPTCCRQWGHHRLRQL